MGRDIVYDPDPSVLNSLLEEDKYFQTIDVTEGLGAASNLQSLNKQVIRLGVKAYRIRYRNNIVVWEYQMTDRPPRLLTTRFNAWIHKMNWYWGVLSIPSSFYRTKDPLYLKRIEDIADNDTKLARWFTNKRQNPNYIVKFKAPYMSEKAQAIFNHHMKEADKRMVQIDEMKGATQNRYFQIAKEIHDRVNVLHIMGEDQILSDLISKGFNKTQVEKVIKLYNEYDAARKWAKKEGGG